MLLLLDDQKVTYTLSATDDAGNPALPFSSVPVWSVSDAAMLSVTAAADGMSAEVDALGPLGTAQVSVAVDGLTGSDDITVGASAAATIVVSAGTPSHK